MLRAIWQWEWHALVVWAIVAGVGTPLLAIYLRRAIIVMMRKHRTLLHTRAATP